MDYGHESSGEGCARAGTRGTEICIAAAGAAAAAEGHCITMCAKWLIPPPPHSRTAPGRRPGRARAPPRRLNRA